jgi:Flp pilus assembly protein TadD
MLLKLGDAYLQEGKPAEAKICYVDAAMLFPGDPRPIFRQALSAVGNGDIQRAETLVDSALTIDPSYDPAQTWKRLNELRK